MKAFADILLRMVLALSLLSFSGCAVSDIPNPVARGAAVGAIAGASAGVVIAGVTTASSKLHDDSSADDDSDHDDENVRLALGFVVVPVVCAAVGSVVGVVWGIFDSSTNKSSDEVRKKKPWRNRR